MPGVATALSTAAHVVGVLCVLAGGVTFLAADAVVARGTVAWYVRGFEEGTFKVAKVAHFVPGPRDDSSETYYLEGMVRGRVEYYHPRRWFGHSVGQELPVLYNPEVPFNDLRVVEWEADFAGAQRARMLKLLLLVYTPFVVFLVASVLVMKVRQRAERVDPAWVYPRMAVFAALFGLAGSVGVRLLLMS